MSWAWWWRTTDVCDAWPSLWQEEKMVMAVAMVNLVMIVIWQNHQNCTGKLQVATPISSSLHHNAAVINRLLWFICWAAISVTSKRDYPDNTCTVSLQPPISDHCLEYWSSRPPSDRCLEYWSSRPSSDRCLEYWSLDEVEKTWN